jgi:amidase
VRLDEYASYDATGLAELVRRKVVTPAELARCVVEAVAAVDSQLGAVVEVFADRVENPRAAPDVDPRAPFAGVPTMLKDLYHGEPGTVCENGSRLCEGWVVKEESGLTADVRRAGLVNLGRTTTSEFGILGTTETLAAGRTATPWSTDHMAGGSSGGSAAAVGAGIVPVASASDGGGSIRIPASACGVVGLKPSRGRVSWGPEVAEALSGWAVHFMVSRSVRDTAALLDALSRPSPGDPFVIAAPPRPFAEEVGAPVGRLRIGVATRPWSGHPPDDEVTDATLATAALLADLGHDVEQTEGLIDWEPFLIAMTDVWAADSAYSVDAMATVVGRPVDETTVEGATLAAVAYGRTVTARQLMAGLDHANLVARAMGRYFGTYDVLLTPSLGRLPARLGSYDPGATIELDELFSAWSPWESFLPAFNATGQPGISLPLQQARTGLPIGMQFVGAFGSEPLLLRLAAQLEEALPWSGRVPPLHVSRRA